MLSGRHPSQSFTSPKKPALDDKDENSTENF
jgi:hypothetical protein